MARSVVLWDVGGTLLDYDMSEEEFARQCIETAGIDPNDLPEENYSEATDLLKEYQESWRTLDEEEAGYVELARVLLRGSAASPDQIRQVGKRCADYFKIFAPIPGVQHILNELRAAGVTQAVISNWPPSLPNLLAYHDLLRYFKTVKVSAAEGVAKPNHELFLRAMQDLNVSPAQCVYVGDDPTNDVAPSLDLGIVPIHFNPVGEHPEADARDAQTLRDLLFPIIGVNHTNTDAARQ